MDKGRKKTGLNNIKQILLYFKKSKSRLGYCHRMSNMDSLSLVGLLWVKYKAICLNLIAH